MKTAVSERGHLFQMFGNTGLGIPMGIISGCLEEIQPNSDGELSKQKFTDARRTLSCGGWSHFCCYLPLTLMT